MNLSGITYTPEQRAAMQAEAVKTYTSGATIGATAALIGCSPAYVRNLLLEAGTPIRPRRQGINLPEGMLTSRQVADLVEMSHASFNTMRHRGDGPPPASERPLGAPSNYMYYWRRDVEKWIGESDQRRRDRELNQQAELARRADALRNAAALLAVTPDWDAVLKAVDEKRVERGLSWRAVCYSAGTDEGYLSRLRAGYRPGLCGLFFRLTIWALGEIPAEFKAYLRTDPT